MHSRTRQIGIHQQGFVLVATLWMLAALTIAVGYFAGWAERAVERAQQQVSGLEAEIDRRSTEAVLIYLLSTRQMHTNYLDTGSPALANVRAAAVDSLTEETTGPDNSGSGPGIALNDRVFRGVGSAVFSLQDQAGLVGLYSTPQLASLLAFLGISSEESAILQARLEDYVDADSLYRVNGGEANDYLRDGFRPPTNLPLHTTWETEAILGWTEHTALWNQGQLPRATTATFVRHLNPFTAPPLVLESLGIISSQQAIEMTEALQSREEHGLFDTMETLSPRQVLESDSLAALPASHLRFTLSATNSPVVEEVHIELTPASLYGPPWRVHTALMLPKNVVDNSTRFSDLPPNSQVGAWSLFADAPGVGMTSRN